MAICFEVWRQRLLVQALQHHTVASMSPTPAQRGSNALVCGFVAAGFAALLAARLKPRLSACSVVRQGAFRV